MKSHKRLLLTVSLVGILVLSLVFGTAASAAAAVGHPDSWFTGNTASTAGANGSDENGANGAGDKVAWPQKLLDKIGITEEYFKQLRDSGMNVKDILIAGTIAKAAKAPVADVIAANQAGKTWQQIAADYEINLKGLKGRLTGWMNGTKERKDLRDRFAGGKDGKTVTPADRITAVQKRIDNENKQLANLDQRIADLEKQAAEQTDAQKKQNLEERAQIMRLQKKVVQAQLDRDNCILQTLQGHQQ